MVQTKTRKISINNDINDIEIVNVNGIYISKKRNKKEGEITMQEQAKKIVIEYFNSHVDKTDNKQITINDVYIVWFSKTLQNWKALVSTTVSDGMYYEITHNGNENETYVDVYKKWENYTVKGE